MAVCDVSEENSIYLVLAIGCAIVVIGGYNRGDSIRVRPPMLRTWRFGFRVWIRVRFRFQFGCCCWWVGCWVVFDWWCRWWANK